MTEKEIKQLEVKGERYKVYLENYLYVDVMITGSKFYRVRLKNKTVTIGNVNELSLKKARILADDELRKLKKPKHKVVLFEQVLCEWLEHKEWAPSTRKSRMKVIDKYLKIFFKKPVDKVEKRDIIELLKGLEAEGKIDTAQRILGILNEIFDYAIILDFIDAKPTTALHRILKKGEVKNRAALTDETDVRRLIEAINTIENEVVRSLLLFTAYTLCRPSECREAKWSEIHGDKWIIPAQRMKMRTEHIVPLSSQCLEILEVMKKHKVSDYIFPSPVNSNQALSENTPLKALRSLGYTKDKMSVHGFRAMASTILNEQGYNFDVVEKALAHSGHDRIRETYNRAEYYKMRKDMLQDYANYLNGIAKVEEIEEKGLEAPIQEVIEKPKVKKKRISNEIQLSLFD